jgi:hypothetical protein
MYMTSFPTLFPNQANETRYLIITGHPSLPDDHYALMEYYCTDPTCDCQMVMLQVRRNKDHLQNLASICYVFDPTDDRFGPMLDIGPLPSPYTEILFELVKPILEDKVYIDRLISHYIQVKKNKTKVKHLRLPNPRNTGLEQFKNKSRSRKR